MSEEFSIGDIVRYDKGPTALMRITHISRDHGGAGKHRYYGIQYFGDSMGVYHGNLKRATEAEIELWNTDNNCGRLATVKAKWERDMTPAPAKAEGNDE